MKEKKKRTGSARKGTAGPRRSPSMKGPAKEESTRKKILKAGRKVFALHAFRAATTRMIAHEAGIDHPLIHYHFGSKEELFEAVCEDVYEAFAKEHLACFEGVRNMSPREGLSLYLDRLLTYCIAEPEPLQLVFLNMVHIGRVQEIPGYRYLLMHMSRVRQTLQEQSSLQGTAEEIDRFIHSVHTLVISFIGAKSYHAKVLRIDPDGERYRKWVKQALMSMSLPALEKLIFTELR